MPLAVLVHRRKTPRILGRPPTKWSRAIRHSFCGFVCKKKPSKQQRMWSVQWQRLPASKGRAIRLLACRTTTFQITGAVVS
jgi:hypothetical protein